MNPESKTVADLSVAGVRQRLDGAKGPEYWRSLDELAQTEEFHELVQREFPQMLPLEDSEFSRRRFVQLMGASIALAGLSACSIQPEEKILPYQKQPEEIVPGKPLYFATARSTGGFGRGLLIESHMGRPTKVEGNPSHPSSLGATDLFDQASILGLYDPDRMQSVSYKGTLRSWEKMAEALENDLAAQRGLGGEGLRVLMENTASPTTRDQLRRLRDMYPRAKFVHFDAAGSDRARAGARDAFGKPTHLTYDLSKADVVVTFDCDLLTEGPGAVRYARDFAAQRRVVEDDHHMNRLYCIESTPTNTGNLADHRLALAPDDLERMLVALASAVGVPGVVATVDGEMQTWVDAMAKDLRDHRGSALVVAGDSAKAEAHVLVHAINDRIGAMRNTVIAHDSVLAQDSDGIAALRELTADLDANKVDVLVILGGNPVYDAPADIDFAAAMRKAKTTVRFGLYADETANLAQWQSPLSHYLESWGDTLAHDTSACIMQPLIAPLYGTHSENECLELLLGNDAAKGMDIVRRTWNVGATTSEKTWRRWLHDGLMADSAESSVSRVVNGGAVRRAAASLGGGGGLTVVFRADPTIGSGDFANNGWLQECPKPHTRITWDNAALISPATAERLGVDNEEIVEITSGTATLRIAAWILPGQAEDTVTLHLGYGRERAGRVGNGCGADASILRNSDDPWLAAGISLTATGERYRLASTQIHHNMEGRDLVRQTTLDDLHHGGHGDHEGGHHLDPNLSLMPGHAYDGYRWGMAIDLTACTGCNACVVACHSENNIAVVGKDEVLNGRELHWMRIDRYFGGDLDQPSTYLQPVMCQHCEQAPCEVVCPVSATVHTDEGINTMAYNRCVGTRYCANNCPYKVRRFNFYQYSDYDTESVKLQRNPDVTVRHRGVMEKCTYCIQRINHAKIEATVQDLPLAETGLQSACQQVCPTGAIEFGDLNDSAARVTKWQSSQLNYGILAELGTRPRTTYLKRVTNPNPELVRS